MKLYQRTRKHANDVRRGRSKQRPYRAWTSYLATRQEAACRGAACCAHGEHRPASLTLPLRAIVLQLTVLSSLLLFCPSFAQTPPTPPPPSEAAPAPAPPPEAAAQPKPKAAAAPSKAVPAAKPVKTPSAKPALVSPKPSATIAAPPPPPDEAASTPSKAAGTPVPATPSEAAPSPSPATAKPNAGTGKAAKPVPATTTAPAAPSSAPAEDSDAVANQDNVAPGWPSVGSVFGSPFMRLALLAGLIVTGVCAYVGVYVVLKRIVFVGIALAEVSSAGVALALLMGFNPFLGAVALMFVGIGLFSVRWAPRKVGQEAFIGIGWAVASAFGVLLIAKNAKGETSMQDILFGNILTVDKSAVLSTALGLAVVLVIHAMFAKEFLFVSFDADTADAMGYRARRWDLLVYATIGLVIAFSIHTVGVLHAFAALVLPPVTALLLTKRMKTAFITSVILGVIAVPIGLYLSYAQNLPASATVVAVMFGILLLGGVASKMVRSGA